MATNEMLYDGASADPLVVLAHGAGAAMDSDWMNVVAAELAAHRLRVARFEFPYMARRRDTGKRGGPDRPAVLVDTWRQVVADLGGGDRVVIGGKSMGGRIATMVADELGVRGVLPFGYPFHPPGRPEKTRTAHLADLGIPTLILQGERDPFGTPDDVAGYRLSPAIRVHWLADGDHSLKPRVKSGRNLADNISEACDAAAAFVRALPG